MGTPGIPDSLKFLLFLFLMPGFSSCLKREANPVRVHDGILDLRSYSFPEEGPVNIRGGWEFYHRRFIHPSDSDYKAITRFPVYLDVPDNWVEKVPVPKNDNSIVPDPVPRHTFGSYRLRILLPPETENQTIGLRIFEIGTAYRLYINGKLTQNAGNPGTDEETSYPVKARRYAYFTSDGEEAELIFHVSNFHHRSGGIWYGIEIGGTVQIRNLRNSDLFYEFTMFGAILMIGIYHMGLFFFRKSDYGALTFSLFCFAVTLRLLNYNEAYLLDLIPGLTYNWKLRLEYLATFTATAFFTAFSQSLFPFRKMNQVIVLWQILNAALIFFVLLTPPVFFTMILNYYPFMAAAAVIISLILVSVAMHRQIQGAPVALFGMIILGVTYINDIFHALGVIHTYYMIQEGVLIFIISQSFIMAQKFADAFFVARSLTENLEGLIKDRTRSLRSAMESKRHLLHVISHDLRNTLGNVQNAADTLLQEDSLSVQEKRNLLKMILSNAELSLHMIDEVNRIDAIKSGKISLRILPIRISEAIEKSVALNADRIREKNIELEIAGLPDGLVCSDPDFLSASVFGNIISNAVKFSYPGQKIIISGTLQKESGTTEICIKDFGMGIPEKAVSRIFDPSTRTTSLGTLGEKGTGFGLPLAHQFIEASGGSIRIESVARKGGGMAEVISSDVFGTKVCVTLPLCPG